MQVTRILDNVNRGDPEAVGRLAAVVYDELHRLASGQLRDERADHTLQPTALVNEAFLRLFGDKDVEWHNRAHFFTAAATAMRRILVEYARSKRAQKRGGDGRKVSLHDTIDGSQSTPEVVLAINDALDKLAQVDPQKSRIVELRFFGGLTTEETARVLEVTTRTVERHWTTARAWLAREIDAA